MRSVKVPGDGARGSSRCGAITIKSKDATVSVEIILHLSPIAEVGPWLTRLSNVFLLLLPSRNAPVDLLTFHSSKLLFHLSSHGSIGTAGSVRFALYMKRSPGITNVITFHCQAPAREVSQRNAQRRLVDTGIG